MDDWREGDKGNHLGQLLVRIRGEIQADRTTKYEVPSPKDNDAAPQGVWAPPAPAPAARTAYVPPSRRPGFDATTAISAGSEPPPPPDDTAAPGWFSRPTWSGGDEPPAPGRDWFSSLFGFAECNGPSGRPHETVHKFLEVSDTVMRSRVNGVEYEIGEFSCPSLGALRSDAAVAAARGKGRVRLSEVFGDVSAFHGDERNRLATFQAASQFNCLEFAHPGA